MILTILTKETGMHVKMDGEFCIRLTENLMRSILSIFFNNSLEACNTLGIGT